MNGRPSYLELRCSACSWSEVCGPEAVARWLRKAGKLRFGQDPELDIMHEVLRAAAGRLACPECGTTGLVAGAAADDAADWPGPKPCASCGQPISEERLRVMPQATLCSDCQRNEELSRGKTETEYCPRCGAAMELRARQSGGLTRYVLVCTADPPCRL